jgi:hypothetical protein
MTATIDPYNNGYNDDGYKDTSPYDVYDNTPNSNNSKVQSTAD